MGTLTDLPLSGGGGGGGGGGSAPDPEDLGNASDYTSSGTMLDDLESHFTFNEHTGTRFDSRGNHNLSVVTGTPGNTAGILGDAMTFTGTSYINTASDIVLSPSWYFGLFVQYNASGAPDLMGTYKDGSTCFMAVQLGAAGLVYLRAAGKGLNDETFNSGILIGNNAPHFLEVWYDGVNHLLGVCKDRGTDATQSHTFDFSATATSGPLMFGALGTGYTGAAMTNGWVNACSYYKRIPTTAERNTLYNSGAGTAYPYGATDIEIDLSLGDSFPLVLDATVDSLTFINGTAGQSFELVVNNSGNEINYGAGVVFSGNQPPSLASTGYTRIPGYYDGTRVILGGLALRAGTATLVAGTTTVLCSTVTANTIITVSRAAPGGTTGDLSADPADITPGVSLIINSDSGSDTSSVNYVLAEAQ